MRVGQLQIVQSATTVRGLRPNLLRVYLIQRRLGKAARRRLIPALAELSAELMLLDFPGLPGPVTEEDQLKVDVLPVEGSRGPASVVFAKESRISAHLTAGRIDASTGSVLNRHAQA